MLYLSQAIGRPVLDATASRSARSPTSSSPSAIAIRPSPASSSRPAGGGSSCPGRRRVDRHDRRPAAHRRSTSTSSAAPQRDAACAPTCWTSRSSTSTAARSCASTTCGSTRSRARCISWRSMSARPAAPPARRRGRASGARPELRLPVPERYIDWEDVDPVETSIASIKLRVPHAGPRRAAPGRPRHDHRPARPARPGRRPRLARRRGGRRRHRGDGARHPGRGPRGPRAGAGGRHPGGDEPRRRGRPRRGPVRGGARGDPRAHGAATRRTRSGSCSATRRTRPAAS